MPTDDVKIPKLILPVIVFSQFAGTSLWFAGNAILGDLQVLLNLPADSLGRITSAVQLGFISGTLIFSLFAISDKFSPRKIFFVCSVLGALSNLLVFNAAQGLYSLLTLRYITGFFLAGVYPIGMKIAAGWYQKRLGHAIGLLVGALVLGTSFPHFLKSIGGSLPWQWVIFSVSAIAIVGGCTILLLVPDGPHITTSSGFNPRATYLVFKSRQFRAAALGYFGHMWELYAFWAFVPFILSAHKSSVDANLNVYFWSFIIIAAGSVGCVVGGLISQKSGSVKVAMTQLLLSGVCCVLSPLMFQAPTELFLGFLVVWGIVVVGDSPQFSAITARTAPKKFVGTGLTIVNSIGFAITIVSIEVVNAFSAAINPNYIFWILTVGPVLGLIALKSLLKSFKQ